MEKERKVLNFNLYDKDVYNSYGVDDNPLLNDELAYTIEERANNHKIKTKLAINFNISTISIPPYNMYKVIIS